MHIDFQAIIHHYGYWGIFLILMFEMIGIPFPAETTLTFSGLEWTKGAFSLLPLLVFAVMGNIAGSSLAYVIGYFLGRPAILRFGSKLGITEERLKKAEAKFNRYQVAMVMASKFIAGIRVLIPYLAGINKMPFYLFTLYNSLSAVIWVSLFIVFGRYIGVVWIKYPFLHQYIWAFVVLLLLGAGVYLWLRKRREEA